MVNIVKKIVPESRYYLKCPYEMTPTRIVVHNTANDAPARNEISYMTNNDYETSFHYAVDDKEIVQGLPENRNGWHASDGNGKGNREGIAIEICYSLSGGDRFIKAEQNAVDLIVDILNRYNWDIDKVTKHQDYTNKYCPHRTLDMGWDRFLNMINEKLSETRARPFIVGTKIYNTEDIYLTETAGYGGGQMLLTKNTESIVKKYHYNKGLYMALGTENTYYDAAWTNNYSKFTTTKPPVEEQKEDKVKEVLQLEHTITAEDENYEFPPVQLLSEPEKKANKASKKMVTDTATKLQKTLYSFGVSAKVENVSVGPAITRYELKPAEGVRVSKIANLADDIALNLAAETIRIEAPIPGKQAVGIEIPNKENEVVHFREMIESDAFQNHKSKLAFGLGKDVAGEAVVTDIAKMPHVLIAGATGSGKSVCINTLITSIIYKAKPSEVKLLMIDPKVVELSVYNGIPHLLIPVVTDPKKAAGALAWAVQEMENRYQLFATKGVRDIKGYNDVARQEETGTLPQIVIIIDELADLMMVASKDVEDSICRLAQKARAARNAFSNCNTKAFC